MSQFEKEYAEYNPYNVLEIDPVSTLSLQKCSVTAFTKKVEILIDSRRMEAQNS